MNQRKIFLIDTSVLLYDKCSIHSFPESDVVIPLVVLDELDRFKDKPALLGENARYVNRFLDDLRSLGSLHEGIKISNDQTIRVEINHCTNVPAGLDSSAADNRIIAVAAELAESTKQSVIVVTKDINFRVKCDALGIASEDYYKDAIYVEEGKFYTGQTEILLESDDLIDEFYEKGYLPRSLFDSDFKPNEFAILRSPNKSALGTVQGKKIRQIFSEVSDSVAVRPRNKEQRFALDLLTREDLPLVTLTGIAGSGKTYLALAAAISGLHEERYKRVVITRSIQPVGRDIGYLPGDINEKMAPWLFPIADNFREIFSDVTYFELMKDKGRIEIAPLSHIRGRTFNDSFIIVDEAQNATIHELKTIITRVGQNSKLVLLGDTDQVDTPYIDSLSNGLTIVIEKFKDELLAGHIGLTKGERSKLATLASRII